jgi:hypothetical protein
VYEADAWSHLYEDDENVEVGASYERAIRLLLRRALDTAICGPLVCVSSVLEEMTYIGPLRDLPPRQIEAPKTKTTSRWAKGLAAWESLPGMDPKSVGEINYWLGSDCLNSGYKVSLQRIRELPNNSSVYDLLDKEVNDTREIRDLIEALPERVKVTLEDSSNGLSVMPQDIGVGISQLFPVVVASVYFKEALVAIEQPELHVHPKLQTEMADLFIRQSLDAKNQFLLETHSEHLMLRLLRRVRDSMAALESPNEQPDPLASAPEKTAKKDSIQPGHLAVHYVETTSQGTRFTRLRVSSDGDFLDEWPDGFFDERDSELFY